LIGILVHLISLLMSNEELCICFALLNNYCHTSVCILLCCFGCGRFDYMAVEIEGSLLNIQIFTLKTVFFVIKNWYFFNSKPCTAHIIIDTWEFWKNEILWQWKEVEIGISQVYSYLHLKPLPTFKGKAFLGTPDILFVSNPNWEYKKVELCQS